MDKVYGMDIIESADEIVREAVRKLQFGDYYEAQDLLEKVRPMKQSSHWKLISLNFLATLNWRMGYESIDYIFTSI
jgi:hypothetical protein